MATAPRVRFAPSPTGPLHIGGVRTALYNYLYARQGGGAFILRIEDTDQSRYVPGAEAYITEALAWCGLKLDEGPTVGGAYGPYRQSERGALYAAAVQRLLTADKAYYAFDTPDQLDQQRAAAEANGGVFKYDASTRLKMDNALTLSPQDLERRLTTAEPRVVRLRVDPGEEVIFEDRIRGTVRFASDELDDKVLLKADGLPTYHLANVVDDEHMRITDVIRGEEWLPSTAHHVLLYRAFGWEERMPSFAHLPLILKPEGKGKLSKRDGAKFGIPVFPLHWHDAESGEQYPGFRESGFLPEALVNFLALLGWNPGTEQEIFSLQELTPAFSVDRIGKSGARFDFDKARWFNQQYIARLTPAEFAKRAQQVLAKAWAEKGPSARSAGDAAPTAGGAASPVRVDEAYLQRIAPLIQERLQRLDDLPVVGDYLFNAPATLDFDNLRKRGGALPPEALQAVDDALVSAQPWTASALETSVKTAIAAAGAKAGAVLSSFRIALTGGMHGPDVFQLAEVLTRVDVLARWRRAVSTLSQNLPPAG